jgi:hypothetical protein
MRFFASSHQIQNLSPRTRVLCVLFLIGMLAQAVSGILMHHHGAGWTPASVSAYYRGNEEVASAGENFQIARSFGTLLEVAHFHLVAMPVIVFIIAHLFSMTPIGRQRWAGILCYGGFLFAFGDILAPFAVRFWSASFASVKLISFIGLEACLILMTLGTLMAGLKTFRKDTEVEDEKKALY